MNDEQHDMESSFDETQQNNNNARSNGESKRRRRSRSPVERRNRGGGGSETRASRRVYVANVPFDVKWSDLKDLFRDKIGNVSYCQLFEDENGRSRGCGLVEFQDSAAARKAIEILHRYNYRNRELVVKEDLDCERDRYGRLILPSKGGSGGAGGGGGGAGGGGGSGREKDGRDGRNSMHDSHYESHGGYNSMPLPAAGQQNNFNTYGLSPQFLESLGVNGPLNNRVFVANLDYKVGEKKLEEIFRLAGKVLRVRLYTDSSGTSKGHGTVEFEHPVEAVQAISMFHNQKLYGRPMSIRMDKYECEEMPEVLPSKLPSGLEGIGKGLGIGGQPLNIGKSLLSASLAPPQVAPVQPPPPGGPPPPQQAGQVQSAGNSALSSLTGLAGTLSHPSLGQAALSQLASGAAGGVSASSLSGAGNSLSMQGYADRSLNSLAGPSLATAAGLSGGVNLGSLSSTAQSVLASLSGNSPLSSVTSTLAGLGAGGPQSNAPPPPNNLSVYSTYEREFRDDKYRSPSTDTIVVRNLPANFSWQNLRDRFNEIGEVRYAELKSRGTAVVRFCLERDAQRAVDLMNGIRVDNRPIEVTLYY